MADGFTWFTAVTNEADDSVAFPTAVLIAVFSAGVASTYTSGSIVTQLNIHIYTVDPFYD